VIEETASIDGSIGWCLMIGSICGVFGGCLPELAAREIYGSDPHVITAGTFRPNGQAVVTDGGYRVSGRWPCVAIVKHQQDTGVSQMSDHPIQQGSIGAIAYAERRGHRLHHQIRAGQGRQLHKPDPGAELVHDSSSDFERKARLTTAARPG
jgi:hypothetical protein